MATTMGTMTETTEIPTPRTPAPRTWLVRLSGLRARILGGYFVLLAVATTGTVLITREILVNRLDERINEQLLQEVAELRALADGRDPRTSRPFRGDVRAIFTTFLRRNIPQANETYVTLVGGKLYRRPYADPPYPIYEDESIVGRWRGLSTSDEGVVDTPEGPFQYVAVPVRNEGRTSGVFVVGYFIALEEAEYADAVRAGAIIGLVTLLVGSVLAWLASERLLKRVQEISSTASAISDGDLTRRIEVSGQDELAELARTFNAMLDRLEASFETQRAFIDDAGHELRTPITIIRGHLETMGEDPLERRETLALVRDELGRMSRIVEDLLILTKARRPDFLHPTMLDVEELTRELNDKARALATREWRVDETGRGLIEADRQRLTQAIMQLAQNAVQHTTEEDSISIGSRVDNGQARFWVRDSGPGIPLDDQERIFERFARSRIDFRSSDGAGLGLAIVNAIAEGHHGHVRLHSAPGEGATFTLVMPTDQPRVEPAGDEEL
jgi:two-component system OmpR family sensor kinase